VLRNRPILYGVLRFAVLYGLLAYPWPGLQEAYSSAFRRAGDRIFVEYGEEGIVRFLPAERPSRTEDSEITTQKKGSPAIGFSNISPRLLGYLPAVEVIALVLASSVPWLRRIFALILGLILIHTFIYLRVWLLLVMSFSNDTPWKLNDYGPKTMKLLSGANEIITIAPTATVVIPGLICTHSHLGRGWGR